MANLGSGDRCQERERGGGGPGGGGRGRREGGRGRPTRYALPSGECSELRPKSTKCGAPSFTLWARLPMPTERESEREREGVREGESQRGRESERERERERERESPCLSRARRRHTLQRLSRFESFADTCSASYVCVCDICMRYLNAIFVCKYLCTHCMYVIGSGYRGSSQLAPPFELVRIDTSGPRTSQSYGGAACESM